MSKIENMYRQLDLIGERIANLARFEPEPDEGTVIAVTVEYNGNAESVYEYILFRADNGSWYTTGMGSGVKKTWGDLQDFFTDSKVRILRAYEVSEWSAIEGWSDVEEEEEFDGDED